MLTHPTLDQLTAMGLAGMAKAFAELAANPEANTLGHSDWLALLLDREAIHRQDKRMGARLRYAHLRHQASHEDIDYRTARGLDRALLRGLIEGDWIKAHNNLVITGPTGVGKIWLACAPGHKACRDNHSVLYVRAPRLFDDLTLAQGGGSAARRIKTLGAVEQLIIDDWALKPLNVQAKHDLLEILEDRYGRKSTRVTSEAPIADWHALIGHATYADAIFDRLVHTAHRIDLTGESMCRTKAKPRA
jgi:DNA replication protein DnaC